MKKCYYVFSGRYTSQQRALLEQAGLHVYSLRSWDEDCGATIEHYVLVNHEGDLVTNFKILKDDPKDYVNDMWEELEKHDAEDSRVFSNKIEKILKRRK